MDTPSMPVPVAGVVKMVTTTLMMMIMITMTKATNYHKFHKDNNKGNVRITK
jgi:hypothetical protein